MARTRSLIIVVGGGALLAAAAVLGRRQWLLADIANRNINKQTCSCVFVGRRSLKACIADIPPAERLHLDHVVFALDSTSDRKSLTNTMFGVIRSTAVYEEGTGCTQY